MFSGFVNLDGMFTDYLQTAGADQSPYTPDAAPSYAIYSPAGAVAGQSGTCTPAGATGLYLLNLGIAGTSGYAQGQYWVRYTWTQGAAPRTETHGFVVC
jgi:hypothetical protein